MDYDDGKRSKKRKCNQEEEEITHHCSKSSLKMDYDDGKRSKKRKCNQEEEEIRTNWLDLIPHEVALDIISRLPMKSLIQSRFVCKIWQNLTYDPQLVSMHLSKSLKGNPYFIFHCDFPIKNQLYFVEISNCDDDYDDDDDTEQEKVRKIDAPFSASMPEFNVIGSCNGILCLENSLFDDSLYLYNPFTVDYTELPKSTVFQDQQVMYGFGFHPISNQYKLIKIVYYANTYDVNATITPNRRCMVNKNLKSDAQIFSLGSKKWRSIGRVPYRFDRGSSAVLLNGRLHWTTSNGFYNSGHDRRRLIVSFDISDEVFREVPCIELRNWLSSRNYHLAVLGGCLCVAAPVDANCGTLDVWIMKEYDTKESWVKEFSIEVYPPTNLRTRELQRSYGIWRNVLNGRLVRVLCLLKNGEILLEFKGGTLVSYNSETGIFKNVTFQGVPNPTKTILHIGSLNRVDTPS